MRLALLRGFALCRLSFGVAAFALAACTGGSPDETRSDAGGTTAPSQGGGGGVGPEGTGGSTPQATGGSATGGTQGATGGSQGGASSAGGGGSAIGGGSSSSDAAVLGGSASGGANGDAAAAAGGNGGRGGGSDASTVPADANSNCTTRTAGPAGPRKARSGGYTGTIEAYSALYDVTCTGLSECVTACTQAGGTTSSCTDGSECVDGSTHKYCLPPTYWRNTDQVLAEDGNSDGTGSAEQTLVSINYQDPILVTDFGLQIPADAHIRGIQFDVRRNVLTQDAATDDSVRILRGGSPVGTDHKKSGVKWSSSLQYVTYGGPDDLWGEAFTPADVAGAGFGLSIAARYTDTAGNDRAYVDYVRATVYYAAGNCP